MLFYLIPCCYIEHFLIKKSSGSKNALKRGQICKSITDDQCKVRTYGHHIIIYNHIIKSFSETKAPFVPVSASDEESINESNSKDCRYCRSNVYKSTNLLLENRSSYNREALRHFHLQLSIKMHINVSVFGKQQTNHAKMESLRK